MGFSPPSRGPSNRRSPPASFPLTLRATPARGRLVPLQTSPPGAGPAWPPSLALRPPLGAARRERPGHLAWWSRLSAPAENIPPPPPPPPGTPPTRSRRSDLQVRGPQPRRLPGRVTCRTTRGDRRPMGSGGASDAGRGHRRSGRGYEAALLTLPGCGPRGCDPLAPRDPGARGLGRRPMGVRRRPCLQPLRRCPSSRLSHHRPQLRGVRILCAVPPHNVTQTAACGLDARPVYLPPTIDCTAALLHPHHTHTQATGTYLRRGSKFREVQFK